MVGPDHTTARPEAGRRLRAPTSLLVPVASVGLVATYLLTWALWQPRTDPVNVAVVEPLGAVTFGLPLALAAAVAVAFPRVGAIVHAGLLVLAVLGDQLRLQPEVVSLALLLVVGAWPSELGFVGRWHLLTLWFWTGMHKVLSTGWPDGSAAFIAEAISLPGLRGAVAVAVPLTEIGLALLAVWQPAWRVLRLAAPAFHLGVVAVLALAWWNTAVWPWNLSLAIAAPLLFGWPAARLAPAPADRASAAATGLLPGRGRRAAAAVAIALAVYPAGFYLGWVDAYLAHNLYTSNTARASVCAAGRADCAPAYGSIRPGLNVPLPPERRVFVGIFVRTCEPGQHLRLDGIRTRLSAPAVSYLPCPATGAAGSRGSRAPQLFCGYGAILSPAGLRLRAGDQPVDHELPS